MNTQTSPRPTWTISYQEKKEMVHTDMRSNPSQTVVHGLSLPTITCEEHNYSLARQSASIRLVRIHKHLILSLRSSQPDISLVFEAFPQKRTFVFAVVLGRHRDIKWACGALNAVGVVTCRVEQTLAHGPVFLLSHPSTF